MAYGIKLMVWGDYASFNRPEMKVERVSYDVMTPSAARGILEAIHWKPGIKWVVDEIHVFAPIRFTHVRRNEVSCKIPTKGNVAAAMRGEPVALGAAVEEFRQQRAAMILRNVHYGIAAHLEIIRPDMGPDGKPLANPEAKHLESFKRRASKGQFFHQPYLGTREFPASFELVDEFPACPDELRGERDLGIMLHDLEFTPDKNGKIIESNDGRRVSATARFFNAVMREGVILITESLKSLDDGEDRQ
jgi:CRISPR-associated protein Cas5d